MVAPSSAPSTPSGTTSSTATGIDSLSYSAASTRKAASSDSANSIGACEPEVFSSSDWPVHSIAEARRQLLRQAFQLVHRLAGRAAGGGVAGDADGRVAVVAHQLHRTLDPVRGGERGERHHGSIAAARVELHDVFRLQAARRVGLHDDALLAPAAGEVVDVGRAERDRQHAVDVGEGHAQRVGFFAVDVDLQLRRVFQPLGTHALEDGALGGQAEQLVARGDQCLVAQRAAVLQGAP